MVKSTLTQILSAAEYKNSCPGRILQISFKSYFPPFTPPPVYSLVLKHLQSKRLQIGEGQNNLGTISTPWDAAKAAELVQIQEQREVSDRGAGSASAAIRTDRRYNTRRVCRVSSVGWHYTNYELTRIRWSLSNRSCSAPGYLSSFQSSSLNLLFPFSEECFPLPLHLSNLQRLKDFFLKTI